MTIQNDVERSNKTKYIEEKAIKLIELIKQIVEVDITIEGSRLYVYELCEDFIRSIMSEVGQLTSDKPKVDKLTLREMWRMKFKHGCSFEDMLNLAKILNVEVAE